MSDDNMQMDDAEFQRANFFTPDNEFAALKTEAERLIAARKAAKDARRAIRTAHPELRALKLFVRVLEAVDERSRCAAVAWLADKYLGAKLYGRGTRSLAHGDEVGIDAARSQG